MAPKTITVNKVITPTTVATTHATAESYVVASNGDLIVLDPSDNVVASYPKGTWGSVRSGA